MALEVTSLQSSKASSFAEVADIVGVIGEFLCLGMCESLEPSTQSSSLVAAVPELHASLAAMRLVSRTWNEVAGPLMIDGLAALAPAFRRSEFDAAETGRLFVERERYRFRQPAHPRRAVAPLKESLLSMWKCVPTYTSPSAILFEFVECHMPSRISFPEYLLLVSGVFFTQFKLPDFEDAGVPVHASSSGTERIFAGTAVLQFTTTKSTPEDRNEERLSLVPTFYNVEEDVYSSQIQWRSVWSLSGLRDHFFMSGHEIDDSIAKSFIESVIVPRRNAAEQQQGKTPGVVKSIDRFTLTQEEAYDVSVCSCRFGA